MEIALVAVGLAVVGSRRLSHAVWALALQAWLLGVWLLASGRRDLAIAGALTLVVKGCFVPYILHSCLRRLPFRPRSGLVMSMKYSMACAVAIVVITYWAVGTGWLQHLAPALSVMLLGVFVMISRTKTVMQAVGLLVVENGIALAAIRLTGGLPAAVELGVLLDAGIAAALMAVFSSRIGLEFGTLSTTELTDLRG